MQYDLLGLARNDFVSVKQLVGPFWFQIEDQKLPPMGLKCKDMFTISSLHLGQPTMDNVEFLHGIWCCYAKKKKSSLTFSTENDRIKICVGICYISDQITELSNTIH